MTHISIKNVISIDVSIHSSTCKDMEACVNHYTKRSIKRYHTKHRHFLLHMNLYYEFLMNPYSIHIKQRILLLLRLNRNSFV